MKISFAVSSLEIIPSDHILARRHSDLDALKATAKDNAPALVELALKSSGGTLHLDGLEKLLKGAIVPDAITKSGGKVPSALSKRTVMSSCQPNAPKTWSCVIRPRALETKWSNPSSPRVI
jgi:hypothetical protein